MTSWWLEAGRRASRRPWRWPNVWARRRASRWSTARPAAPTPSACSRWRPPPCGCWATSACGARWSRRRKPCAPWRSPTASRTIRSAGRNCRSPRARARRWRISCPTIRCSPRSPRAAPRRPSRASPGRRSASTGSAPSASLRSPTGAFLKRGWSPPRMGATRAYAPAPESPRSNGTIARPASSRPSTTSATMMRSPSRSSFRPGRSPACR